MTLKYFWMSTAVATMIAGGALAQDTATPETGVASGGADTAVIAPKFMSLEEMTVGDMIGTFVYDPEGERISEIDYVIAGVGGPEVVLGIGGFLGLGEYTVALPLTDFKLGEDGLSLRLDTDKETLKTYPEFDESMAENLPAETSIGTLLTQAGDSSSMTTGEGAAESDAATDEPATDDATQMEEGDMTDEGTTEGETTEETTTQ